MKKIFFLMLILTITAFFSESMNAQTEQQMIEACTRVAGADANMLNHYVINLPAVRPGERPQPFRVVIGLRAGNQYRVTICVGDDSPGEAIVRVTNGPRTEGTNEAEGVIHQNFNFNCNSTGPHTFIVTSKDGREVSAVLIVSHVRTL